MIIIKKKNVTGLGLGLVKKKKNLCTFQLIRLIRYPVNIQDQYFYIYLKPLFQIF